MRILAATLFLTAAEILLLYRLSEWTTDYKLTFSVLPNTLLLFYGLLRIRSETVRTYHRVIGIFSAVTFFGHILFMKINLRLLGWNTLSLTVVQDFVYLLLTLAECAAATLLIVSLRGKEGRSFSSGRRMPHHRD
ncbi:hypothetical protein KP806_27105 [Paenibacillus sp. N4]|uniref:hypothetical protein n=1 Tax=Paenibacillus vietnamensis TaxID=2590547 RepID=UPI001CD15BC3|nr:hypothetical protein [Paenibacillus vietnamensis]MCA0758730.1 hypothetical protein [Paenibacillus vietnamensis]